MHRVSFPHVGPPHLENFVSATPLEARELRVLGVPRGLVFVFILIFKLYLTAACDIWEIVFKIVFEF